MEEDESNLDRKKKKEKYATTSDGYKSVKKSISNGRKKKKEKHATTDGYKSVKKMSISHENQDGADQEEDEGQEYLMQV